jgi:hypothetical protein
MIYRDDFLIRLPPPAVGSRTSSAGGNRDIFYREVYHMQKIVLPESLQKEMLKFFLRTSIPRQKKLKSAVKKK